MSDDEKACYCASRQCDICTPDTGVLPEEPPKPDNYFDACVETWRNAAQTLAADNARLCGIALAADELAESARAYYLVRNRTNERNLRSALDAYKIARQGQ